LPLFSLGHGRLHLGRLGLFKALSCFLKYIFLGDQWQEIQLMKRRKPGFP